jgi:hypothetical protein
MLRHERLLFALATLGGLVHAVDEVFFAEEAYRAIPVAIGSALVLAYYPRLGATARGALSLLFGLFWLGGIVTHWIPLIDDGSSPGDWTSLASVPAGALFLALGIAVLARRRELTPPASPRPG